MRNVIVAGALATAVTLIGGSVHEAATPEPDTGQFTACMRAHGLPDFPEVTFSSEGLVNLSIGGERVDVLSEKYGAAVKACESLLPSGTRLPVAPAAPTPF